MPLAIKNNESFGPILDSLSKGAGDEDPGTVWEGKLIIIKSKLYLLQRLLV